MLREILYFQRFEFLILFDGYLIGIIKLFELQQPFYRRWQNGGVRK